MTNTIYTYRFMFFNLRGNRGLELDAGLRLGLEIIHNLITLFKRPIQHTDTDLHSQNG